MRNQFFFQISSKSSHNQGCLHENFNFFLVYLAILRGIFFAILNIQAKTAIF